MSSKGKSSAETGGGTALVPKLRFPEFRDAGGWKPKRLGRFLSESRLPGSKGDVAKKITVRLWAGGVFAKNEAVQGSANTQYFQRKSGQLIYSKLDFLNQAFGIIPDELDGYESTADLPCFDISGDLNSAFILECVERKSFYLRVGEAADGSRIAKRIHPETFLASEIPLPSLSEQQKIADCLASADALIEAQGRKVEALKAYKKGLMQQLFPQEGETQPRLRFPEFEGAREWEIKPLAEVATYENGKAYEQDIADDGKYIVVNSRFISTDGAAQKYTNADHLTASAGDILMVLSDLPKGRALAKCYYVGADDRYAVNQRICRLKGKRLDSKFLFFVINRNPHLLAYDDGQNQTHLSKGNVLDCPLCIPPSKAEQQRIADCLTSLDGGIAAEIGRLNTLKTHKRGLMQQLFPRVGEVDA